MIGHQRAPAFSMNAKRDSQCGLRERRRIAAEAPAVQLEAEQVQPVLQAQQADEALVPGRARARAREQLRAGARATAG